MLKAKCRKIEAVPISGRDIVRQKKQLTSFFSFFFSFQVCYIQDNTCRMTSHDFLLRQPAAKSAIRINSTRLLTK